MQYLIFYKYYNKKFFISQKISLLIFLTHFLYILYKKFFKKSDGGSEWTRTIARHKPPIRLAI